MPELGPNGRYMYLPHEAYKRHGPAPVSETTGTKPTQASCFRIHRRHASFSTVMTRQKTSGG